MSTFFNSCPLGIFEIFLPLWHLLSIVDPAPLA